MNDMNTYLFGGDWHFFWQQSIHDLSHFPSAWDSFLNSGLGTPGLDILWLNSYLNFTSWISTTFHIPWFWISLVFWIIPPVIISTVSFYYFFIKLIPINKLYAFLAAFIFTSNTYFLMVYTGGQLGISFAYSLIPAVLLSALYNFRNINFRNSIISGLVFAIALLFDPRIFFIDFILLLALWITQFRRTQLFKQLIYAFIIPMIIMIILNAFWVLPFIFYPNVAVGANVSSTAEQAFFSFANFPQTFSLLHPYWPENIFGKVGFMNGAFLILPMLAFSTLQFVNKVNGNEKTTNTRFNRIIILVFCFVGLLGAFLAKGVNEPFGNINAFLFDHVAVMRLFRDSTKFYMLVSVAFSLLIPYAVYLWSEKFKIKKFYLGYISFGFILLLLVLTSRGVLFKKFLPIKVPTDYVQLAGFLQKDTQYSRTLWLPTIQRYAYTSSTHPGVSAPEFFSTSSQSAMIKKLQSPDILKKIQDDSIKYILIPDDTNGEIFVNDRKYDDKLYKSTVKQLNSIAYLRKEKSFGNILVYKVNNPKDHFWTDNNRTKIMYQKINSTHYRIGVTNAKQGETFIFSESFNPHWYITYKNSEIFSNKFNKLNSFVLPATGNYSIDLDFKPQKFVIIGAWISGFWLVFIILFFSINRKKS